MGKAAESILIALECLLAELQKTAERLGQVAGLEDVRCLDVGLPVHDL